MARCIREGRTVPVRVRVWRGRGGIVWAAFRRLEEGGMERR